jgi:outer membrane protein OmpA-like peptidoglycan-associated protein
MRAAAVLATGLIATGLASADSGQTRQQTLETLEALSGSDAGKLRVWINDGDQEQVTLGDRVVFRFRSESDGYLTAVYLDGHGVATLLYPNTDSEAGRIRAGQEKTFPPAGASWELQAQLPLGRETLIAVLTPEPITAGDLGVRLPPGELLVVDAGDAPALAKSIASRADAQPAGSVSVARAEQVIMPSLLMLAGAEPMPGTTRSAPQYTKRQIVDYFSTRHRSITRPKLDLQIQFDTDSARLTPSARRDLDEVGKALADGKLSSSHFLLGGHTDDVGEPEYNDSLSVKRANAARQYLVETHQVDPERLESKGFGEAQPLVPGTSEAARAVNRRVVLEMLR